MTGKIHGLTAGLAVAAVIWAFTSPAPAARGDTITVCPEGSGDYTTIQAALDAAADGDEIIVCDGVYTGPDNKNLDFHGKAITLRSANGPDNCIIDCEGDGRGFYFHSGEVPVSVLDGFTITNGHVTGNGGAVYGFVSSPTITNCIITGNEADQGGGVACSDSYTTISNCLVSNNTAYHGGGVDCASASVTITACTFRGNTALVYGGGVACRSNSNATISNCTFIMNSASQGGGISCRTSSNPTITNCTLAGNSAEGGGGTYCFYCNPTFINCTVSANSADYGGGAACKNASPTFTNCILWNDTPEEIALLTGDSILLTYSVVQGGWEGEGNLDVDPLFVDPDGPDDDPTTWEDNDHHLSPDSPCLDAGDPDFVPPAGETDIDGDPRLYDGDADGQPLVDMGADEVVYTGDANCDGAVNAFDIDPFILALENPEAYAAQYPDCDLNLADINDDGALNAFDIDAFIALLTGA